jgi:hypothetical protein
MQFPPGCHRIRGLVADRLPRHLSTVAGVVPAVAPAIAEYSPAAAMRVVEQIEAMVARGFNYGARLAGARPRWVWPVPPLAVYYRDDG